MFNEFLKKAQSLYQDKESFALALVVNRQIPSSGKPGDKAIIRKNGEISGWIGGGCTRGIVLKEASHALEDGKPRLVKITPEGEYQSIPGVKQYPMTCHSGGSVEIYIEPILPRPHILIMGKSHVAMALAKIAHSMDYTTELFAKGAEKAAFPHMTDVSEKEVTPAMVHSNTCIVVCTQGENDEDALEQAINSGAAYISFVASRKKANAVFHQLRQRGITFDQLKRIKTPAGLKINAKLPEEVAISILAEIIEFMRTEEVDSSEAAQAETDRPATPPSGLESNPNFFINPVCGIPIEKNTAKHVIAYEGESYYFCCDGCKVSFEKDPEKYALKN